MEQDFDKKLVKEGKLTFKLKRAYDIKDFGKIFPGHGGVLDRFDSTLIAGALMFVICYMIGVI